MTLSKRLFDIAVALVLAVLLTPVFLVVAALVALLDGRPVLYVSERMRTPTEPFALVKFRTMKPATVNTGVSGGDKEDRITRTGRIMRRTRLDEIPQLWNVLRGDMSFVGPRPPLRQYVELFPELYARVLRSRPGVTGLASVRYSGHETMLLSKSRSIEETDAIYRRSCIPRKATLDLIYQRHRTLCLDVVIMLQSVFRSLR